MAKLGKQSMAGGGGGVFGMEKSISLEKKEKGFFGLDYLKEKYQKTFSNIDYLQHEAIQQAKRIGSYKKGILTQDGYVVKDIETGEEVVYLSREFIDRQLENDFFNREITEEEIIERFQPKMDDFSNNQFDRYVKKMTIIREDSKKLRHFCRNDINKFNYENPEKLLETINFENIKYIEIIAVVEKAVKENNFIVDDLQKMFDAEDSRMKLAIVELLPTLFKQEKQKEKARKFLQEVIIKFTSKFNISDKVGYPTMEDSIYINEFAISYEEDPERAIFIHAALKSLGDFGQNAEANLKNIFERNRSVNRREVEEYNLEMADVAIPEMVIDDIGEGDLYYGVDIDKEGDLIEDELKDMEDGYYYENRHILAILKNIGTRKTIDFICNFITSDNDSVYIYKEEIMNILDAIDVRYASAKLYELLQTSNSKIRERVGKVLFRLEIGKTGISERGVGYLEKVFDLGYLNNPDFFAERITASGVIGIFDEKGVPKNYFKVTVDDLLSDDKIISPEILDFTVEALFYTRGDETEEEKQLREETLEEFKEKYFSVYIENFKKETGVNFNNFELYEQAQFLRYYLGQDEYHKQGLFDFIRKHKENGLKTFLSLEQGGLEMGEKILTIGERFAEKPRLADAIFAKYAELADAVDKVGDYLREEFGREDVELIREIQENLLVRGKAILVLFADEEMTEGEAVNRLNAIEIEVEVLASVLQELKAQGEPIDLGIVKNLKIESKHNVSGEDAKGIILMVKESWQQNVEQNGVSQKFADLIVKGLDIELKSGDIHTDIYIVKYKGAIGGIIRFKDLDNGKMEVKSVNVHPSLKSVDFGKFLFQLIRKRSEHSVLELNVLLKNPVGCHYISKLGFRGYGYNDNMYSTGEPNIYTEVQKGGVGRKNIIKQADDIEKIFDISTSSGLDNVRDFFKEHLLKVDNDGKIVEGQDYENKYIIIDYVQIDKQSGRDVRKIILRKNEER